MATLAIGSSSANSLFGFKEGFGVDTGDTIYRVDLWK